MNLTLTIPYTINDEEATLLSEYSDLGGRIDGLVSQIYEYMDCELNDGKPHFQLQAAEPISLRQMFNQHISHIVAAEIQKLKDRKEAKQ